MSDETQLTKDRKRWMRRLKRCLDDMPIETELVVSGDVYAKLYLLKRGGMDSLFESNESDVLGLDLEGESLERFTHSKVGATSETS